MPTPPVPGPAGAVEDRPLILTLAVDARAQAHFDALRRAHFPPERNHLPAHVTLFHALPAQQRLRVLADVREVSRRSPFPVAVTGVRLLGRGVAYTLSSPELAALRAELAKRWDPWLVAQDRQPFAPHVTVQNKVQPDRARSLHAQLEAQHEPVPVHASGLSLWRYDGGPWTALQVEPFRS